MATELLCYRPAPYSHNESLQRIEELVAAAGDSTVFSCLFRPQPSLANDEEQEAPPHLCGMARTSSLGRKRIPTTGLVNQGWGQEMKQAVRRSLGHARALPVLEILRREHAPLKADPVEHQDQVAPAPAAPVGPVGYTLMYGRETKVHPAPTVIPGYSRPDAGKYPFFAAYFYNGFVPPFSSLFVDVMMTYGFLLLDFTEHGGHHVRFVRLFENFIGIVPNVSLFCHFFIPHIKGANAFSDSTTWIPRPGSKEGRYTWESADPADIMWVNPRRGSDMTFLHQVFLHHQLFLPEGGFILVPSIIQICNNDRKDTIVTIMPECNTHGVTSTCHALAKEVVQELFDNLTVAHIRDEGSTIHATTIAEVDFVVCHTIEADLDVGGNSSRGVALDEEEKEDEDDHEEGRVEEPPAWHRQDEPTGTEGAEAANTEVTVERTLVEPPVHGASKKTRVLCMAATWETVHRNPPLVV
ncbi:hypothetical protein D1007_55919 [Hordeum vulgare]|nr:hypothetical protein D1007_55919 [Hordeum vulgare]